MSFHTAKSSSKQYLNCFNLSCERVIITESEADSIPVLMISLYMCTT